MRGGALNGWIRRQKYRFTRARVCDSAGRPPSRSSLSVLMAQECSGDGPGIDHTTGDRETTVCFSEKSAGNSRHRTREANDSGSLPEITTTLPDFRQPLRRLLIDRIGILFDPFEPGGGSRMRGCRVKTESWTLSCSMDKDRQEGSMVLCFGLIPVLVRRHARGSLEDPREVLRILESQPVGDFADAV